jgi:hypothetical protein
MGLACEVNDISHQQQEPPLIGNPRFLKRDGCQRDGLMFKRLYLLIIEPLEQFRGFNLNNSS